MKAWYSILLLVFVLKVPAQTVPDTVASQPLRSLLRVESADGKRYFQVTFLNQVWLRLSELNPGTTRFGAPAQKSFDIGLRRTRIQLFGQVSERAFLYFQFGQNNFNSATNAIGNRKIAAFFHDALGEYRISAGNQLKLGAGLTVMNGLSRFSQPSISTIMSMDVPVFLQYSVDQIDQFDRRLAVYARGQISKLDYRVYLSNPFPVTSNGAAPPPLARESNFAPTLLSPVANNPGVKNQLGASLAWNFFENEPHNTPYMPGTYLGTKKVWNLWAGAVYQADAMWRQQLNGIRLDTVYEDLLLWCIEMFADLPLNKEKGTAVNFFAGYFSTDYGRNYLRFNGQMNPATASTATNMVRGNAFGNAYPMFGTGSVVYGQAGYLLAKNLLGGQGTLMPYGSIQYATYQGLGGLPMLVTRLGLNWLMSSHNAKLSLDWENRPTYFYAVPGGEIRSGKRKNGIVLQYQVYI